MSLKWHVFNAVAAPVVLAEMIWTGFLPLIVLGAMVCGAAWMAVFIAWLVRRDIARWDTHAE